MNRRTAVHCEIALLAGAALVLFATPVLAENTPDVSARPPAWTLRKASDDPQTGYAIYTSELPGSDFDVYRLEATLDASPEEVAAAALRNVVGTAPNDSNMERKLLRRTEDVVVTYTLVHVPLVADRDIVTRVETSHEASSGIYRLAWSAIDSEGPPPVKGVQRISDSAGAWTFAPDGPGRTRAIYESHTEVEGPMPSWLVNRMMTNTIIDQIVNLRRRVDE